MVVKLEVCRGLIIKVFCFIIKVLYLISVQFMEDDGLHSTSLVNR